MANAALIRTTGLNPALFRKFCRIAHEEAGLHLKDGKEALVSARVSKRMRTLGIANVRGYLRYLQEDPSGEEIVHFVDVVTTNYTRFFREPEHFNELKCFVERSAQAGQTRFKLWCAAAATGEEPYSMAMALAALIESARLDVRILATDISTKALRVAREALYPDKCVADIPTDVRRKSFVPCCDPPGNQPWWQVRPELRARVVFDRVNLSQPPFPMKGPFDAIFCRNVMIYLNQHVRSNLVTEMESLLRPGGLLVVGHAETLTGLRSGLTMIRPSVYQR
jgi:chemotaxis protein methyltransferase CheR